MTNIINFDPAQAAARLSPEADHDVLRATELAAEYARNGVPDAVLARTVLFAGLRLVAAAEGHAAAREYARVVLDDLTREGGGGTA